MNSDNPLSSLIPSGSQMSDWSVTLGVVEIVYMFFFKGQDPWKNKINTMNASVSTESPRQVKGKKS